MKKILMICFSLFIVFGIIGCATNTSKNDNDKTTTEPKFNLDIKTDDKSLVVYFSVPETDNPDNMSSEEEYSTVVIDGKVLGNTQYLANVIQEYVAADIFRIEPVTPYPMNHDELEKVATNEKRNNERPNIAAKIENIDQYGVIFVGFPNWYSDMPMIMYSFFEEYDLTDKTIIPFTTSGASGFSNNISTIQELQPNAKVVEDGLSILRNEIDDSKSVIIDWLNELGYKN